MTAPSPYRGFRFPTEVIEHAVWLYHCFSLGLRNVVTIFAARGVVVSYESIRDWGLRFGRLFANALRRHRPRPGDKWHLDEMFIRIRGKLHYLWRAVDQHGIVLDILGQSRRNAKAAKRFFRKLFKGLQHVPRVVIADRLRSYAAAKREILPGIEHRQSVYLNTGSRCPTSRPDDESGRCSGSSQRAMPSAPSRPTAASTTTSNSAAAARRYGGRAPGRSDAGHGRRAEGGHVLAGAAPGIDGGVALALSLVKRVRDLLVAVPVVLPSQAVSTRRARRSAHGQAAA